MGIFQLTPSQRATQPFLYRKMKFSFQLTPSQRATLSFCQANCAGDFNSRPHRGRQQPEVESFYKNHFNSRPHRGRRKFRQIFLLIAAMLIQYLYIFFLISSPSSPKFYLFSKNPLNFKCESSCFFLCTWHSHYRISVSITSNPAFAPTCSTVLYHS